MSVPDFLMTSASNVAVVESLIQFEAGMMVPGLAEAAKSGARHALVLPGDVPLVTNGDVAAMLAQKRATKSGAPSTVSAATAPASYDPKNPGDPALLDVPTMCDNLGKLAHQT